MPCNHKIRCKGTDFLCLLLLKAFTRRVAKFGGKNYPKACLRGVFSSKVRKSKAQSLQKGLSLFFFLKLSQHY
jgi:hypothetical protein